jgi:hypothetical protein
VLDISPTAIEKAKKRLGENAKKVNWIVADAAHFRTLGVIYALPDMSVSKIGNYRSAWLKNTSIRFVLSYGSSHIKVIANKEYFLALYVWLAKVIEFKIL